MSRRNAAAWRVLLALLAISLLLSGAISSASPVSPRAALTSYADIVPAPMDARPGDGAPFTLHPGSVVSVERGSPEAADVAEHLVGILRPSTGYLLPIVPATEIPRGSNEGIALLLSDVDPAVGEEGYRLDVTERLVVIRARTADGLFAGVQTLRQLLPPKVESRAVQAGPWQVPAGRVLDRPRFTHRGAMLDVARHFIPAEDIKRYIDQIALFKINRLHLHLTDDQGWRIEIKSWPRLATYGGSTQVGGGPGGYYTQEEYREIVEYARLRRITVVPEIDMPGHTNAALASYAELNCDGVAPPLYTGTDVGFSSLCVPREITYQFIDDVIREVAALTPGPYLHIGGDEAHATDPVEYLYFMARVTPIVQKYDKVLVGWNEIAKTDPPEGSLVQYWHLSQTNDEVVEAVRQGSRVVMSPAKHAYLDMKYHPGTPLGLTWAGYIEVADAYGWDPGTYLAGVDESAIAGVEGPLWTETITNLDEIEFMAFPRLAALAELAWSPKDVHGWEEFRHRLGAQGPRWRVMGVDFYPSSQVPWR
ncbi:beta-N-acetylhexosaminidase [Longimycelium tulufanense]|uniref:beta-N-acetylhexosaminidase n=1 Tax=Longimycelium tulufanense TaxID=907463 RepID=A0A8J3CBZ4_9PSEU|nr:beta-N-acetylhexosaminidase [Longimycelium tulufanense]GGM71826.1 beta-N-acetylhexosaminidase [Longimycelium tulufanense]